MNCDLQVTKATDYLDGKRIALCVCGGIAAIETPKIARMLRRYGADVQVYMSDASLKFVGEASLEWATGKPVVSKLSGLAEHICMEDLVLVAPATMNTINKIFTGIADTPITTLVASALGQHKPILIAPTMHESLLENPFFKRNYKDFTTDLNLRFIEPRISEGKAKIPKVRNIVAEVSRTLSTHRIKGKSVLVTAGPTPVHIDSVRVITNIFRGTLGIKIADYAYHMGASVKLLLGAKNSSVPSYLDVKYHRTYDEYVKNVMVLSSSDLHMVPRYDYGVFAAAVADYKPKNPFQGKIPSTQDGLDICWEKTEKVIDLVYDKLKEKQAHNACRLVSFKVEGDISLEELEDICRKRLRKGHYMVVANRLSDMEKNQHIAWKFSCDRELYTKLEGKDEIARGVVDGMCNNW